MAGETKPQNPIRDTNGNGVLDGAELIAQLAAEHGGGQKTVAAQPVHGVLNSTQISTLVQAWNIGMQSDATKAGVLSERIATRIGERLEQRVNDYLAKVKEDPDFVKKGLERIAQMPGPEELKATASANFQSFAAFADNYKQDFPNGVKIESQDSLSILHHFGRLLVPSPTPPQPPEQKQSGQSI